MVLRGTRKPQVDRSATTCRPGLPIDLAVLHEMQEEPLRSLWRLGQVTEMAIRLSVETVSPWVAAAVRPWIATTRGTRTGCR